MNSQPLPTLYRLRLYPNVKLQLRRLRETSQRIARAVEAALVDLRSEPHPPTAEELRDHYAGIWKIKIDGWRLFYEVREGDKLIVIIAIKRRDRDTYRHIP